LVSGHHGIYSIGDTHRGWLRGSFVYHGEIPTEPEQKTTGLNFLEAITACNNGKNIRRPHWLVGQFLHQSNMCLFWQSGEEASLDIDMEEYLATDWQIVQND
jgi:hypothetical protein